MESETQPHRIRLPRWARVAPGGRTHIPSIDPARTALLVVDMQRGFVEPRWPMAIPRATAIVPAINRLAELTRVGGGTVAMIRHGFSDDPERALTAWHARTAPRENGGNYVLRPGSPAHAIHPAIEVAPGDLLVDKYRFSALHPQSSPLRALLDERAIETVIVTGVATNVCCESTARDAQMCGYRVIFVSDATAAFTDLEHNATLLNLGRVFADVRTTEAVSELLSQGISA